MNAFLQKGKDLGFPLNKGIVLSSILTVLALGAPAQEKNLGSEYTLDEDSAFQGSQKDGSNRRTHGCQPIRRVVRYFE